MMDNKPIIIVTGAAGQLGQEIQDVAPLFQDFHWRFFRRNELDISNTAAVRSTLESIRPWAVINTAAYTQVDAAEDALSEAQEINTSALGHLAQACKDFHVRLFHVSTDYVFDGTSSLPYTEEDVCHPINAYGQSKWEGEEAIRNMLKEHFIVRTSWLYSEYGSNFFKTITRIAQQKSEITVVNDQFGGPTWAGELADQLLKLARIAYQHDGQFYGTYHFSNNGMATWCEFAAEIVALQQLNCSVVPITTAQYPTRAKRPKMSKLNTSKWEATVGPVSTWQQALKNCIEKITRKHKM